jgi:hypothetical protein
MPAKHNIDNKNKLITTTWFDTATDSELIDALTKYQREIKSNPDYQAYNEILDLREVGTIKLTTEGIQRIGEIAVKTDQVYIKTKLAIVVSSPLAYGLARMYEAYRNFAPNPNKEIQVFNEISEAHEWIEMKT